MGKFERQRRKLSRKTELKEKDKYKVHFMGV